MTERKNNHGGNVRRLSELAGSAVGDVCDFSANINPLGLPWWFRAEVSRSLEQVVNYPDPECVELINAIAEKYGVSKSQIVVGNGSSEIIYALVDALGFKKAIIPVPCYSDYAAACQRAGVKIEKVTANSKTLAIDLEAVEKKLNGGDAVFVATPNNPTGLTIDNDKLIAIAERNAKTTFVVDEAFVEFTETGSVIGKQPANLIVLRSMTKFYAVPGLRLGFAIAEKEVAEKIKANLCPWSVNSIAQAVGVRLLQDKDYAAKTIKVVSENRKLLSAGLAGIRGLKVYPGQANYLLVEMDGDANQLAKRLLKDDGIAIRVCDNYDGLTNKFFRVAVKSKEDNERLCNAISKAFGSNRKTVTKKRTPAIMFQGCSSNAGKSFLSAALCRVLLQDGVKVAPFKSQNMSLNSFVTRDGGEMGRAQVVQAQACKLDPDVRMNPVLLKPNSDTGSQVIVMGKPVGNMKVGEYTVYKHQAFETVKKAYDSLAGENEVIVIEGAGSPAEINLKADDIVNMQMARYAKSPVLLAGDIDRGGVFASFVGTMELMERWERDLIAGFLVNRFRGDASLLGPALDYTLMHTGKPVLGVIPFIKQSGIPEEDSVGFKADGFEQGEKEKDTIDVVVIDLGHISNFTDFDPLGIEPDVKLRVARTTDEIGRPDAVIIPGSKNVAADLAILKSNGTDKAIRKLAEDGTCVVGICAGFQMLGKLIGDPAGIESSAKEFDGIGLLGVSTVMAAEKTLKLVTAKHGPSGKTVKGYEIHHGRTEISDCRPVVSDGERIIGVSNACGNVWGTYLHGIFDNDEFRRWFVDGLREGKGLKAKGKVCAVYDLEASFDRLADVFRKSVDMDAIYKMIGL